MQLALSSAPRPTQAMLWSALQELVQRVFRALEAREAVLDECLDVVVELLGADRGLVLVVLENGSTLALNARGKGKSLAPEEREEISRTLVREALETQGCATWNATLGSTASIASLGIVSALAVTLPGSVGRRAVLYVDVRDRSKFVQDAHVEFFMAAAAIIGSLVSQHEATEGLRATLDEAQSHTTDARKAATLAELLAPPSMAGVRRELETAIASKASILILGESGTGKTAFAQAIAQASGRRPAVRAMLGGSEDLNTITSELFGHERGSFSGATGRRVGLVEYAHRGVLILDELLNLPLQAQRLLLDFTQFGTYRPLGHDRPEPKHADVRIIAATNGDVRAAVKSGRFREDLFYRLAQVEIELPPLRKRRGDIPMLTEATLARLDPRRRWTLSLPLRRLLVSERLEWSGNVRQLEAVTARARERALFRDPEASELVPEHYEARDLEGSRPESLAAPASGPASDGNVPLSTVWQNIQAERARLDEREQETLKRAVDEAKGTVAHAARALGIARTTLASRLELLRIKDKRSAE